MDANESTDPVRIMFGLVTDVNPLEVTIDQRLIIDNTRLFLSSSVIEREAEETFNMTTESTTVDGESHVHNIIGRKKVVYNDGLKVGEKVMLLRMQGGQRFLILDRVVEKNDS